MVAVLMPPSSAMASVVIPATNFSRARNSLGRGPPVPLGMGPFMPSAACVVVAPEVSGATAVLPRFAQNSLVSSSLSARLANAR